MLNFIIVEMLHFNGEQANRYESTEMSDVVWQALIAAVATIVLAWMQRRTQVTVEDGTRKAVTAVERGTATTAKAVEEGNAVASAAADMAAAKAEEVKTVLVETTRNTENKLDGLVKTSDATHTLVNSNYGVQLQLGAELSRWKAAQTKDSKDIDAAELAEKLLKEHIQKQAMVDNREAKNPPPASKVKG